MSIMEIEESVIEKIRQRRDLGRAKYGTSMERTDLIQKQWLQHAQEEAMDLAIYLEKCIQSADTAFKCEEGACQDKATFFGIVCGKRYCGHHALGLSVRRLNL